MNKYRYSSLELKDIIKLSFYTACMITIGIALGFILGEAFGPGMAIINGLVIPIFLVIGVRSVWKFPSATIMLFVYAAAVSAFPIWGPPGFIHKPIQGLLAGLFFDLILVLISKFSEKWAIVIATAMMVTASVLMMYIAVLLFPEFPADKFKQLAPFLIPLGIPLGAAAGVIGNAIVKRVA